MAFKGFFNLRKTSHDTSFPIEDVFENILVPIAHSINEVLNYIQVIIIPAPVVVQKLIKYVVHKP